MNSLKRIVFLPFALLVACASPKLPPANEIMPPQTPSISDNGPTAAIVTDKSIPKDTGAETPSKDKTTAGKTAAVASNPPPASWELSGAMAARSAKKAWSASVNWVQNGAQSYQIRLFGPLGSGTIMISRKGGAITFRDGPKTVTSSNADELLKQQTGVRLPVNNLFYWVRGIPAPGAVQSSQRDAANRLVLLRQAGYTIQYQGYSASSKTALPSRIVLQGNGVMIKLVIKRWKI